MEDYRRHVERRSRTAGTLPVGYSNGSRRLLDGREHDGMLQIFTRILSEKD